MTDPKNVLHLDHLTMQFGGAFMLILASVLLQII